MGNVACQICEQEFETGKSLHLHLKKHKIRIVEYYQTHYPRHDLHDGNIIKFKNKDQYFSTDFNSKTNLRLWLKEQPKEESQKYLRNFLIKRIEKKHLVYSPTQVELRSLMAAPVQYYNELFGNYYELCEELGLENKYKPFNEIVSGPEWAKSEYMIYIDTREQKPLKFTRPMQVRKLDYGDYAFGSESKLHDCYIERKSLADFVGTLSGGFDRFSREVERSVDAGDYLVVLVESKMSNATSFQFLRKSHDKSRVYKNVRATPEFIMHNMRKIMQEYPKVQFLFVDGRKEAARVMEKIFTSGGAHKQIDLQLAYDLGKL